MEDIAQAQSILRGAEAHPKVIYDLAERLPAVGFKIHLYVFDPMFLKRGRVARLPAIWERKT